MEADDRLSRMEQFFEALRVLRVSWIVALLAVFALAIPPQVLDLYRALADNLLTSQDRAAAWAQMAITALLLVLAALLIHYAGRHRALVHFGRRPESGPVLAFCLRWGPPVCGALVLAAAAAGMYGARLAILDIRSGADPVIDRSLADMRTGAGYLGIAAIVLMCWAILFVIAVRAWDAWLSSATPVLPQHFAFNRPLRFVAYAVAIGMIATAFWAGLSVSFSQWLGSVAIFLVFISVLLVALSVLQTWSDRQGIPWTLVLIVWFLILSASDLNRPLVNLVDRPKVTVVQVQNSFVDWYNARGDKGSFGDEPYPVFLVSAEAGGLYAAQFAAKVLARLQDRCPSFSQHVFAISGVSGGSLGAATFASLAKQHATNGPWQPCRDPGAAPPNTFSFEATTEKVLRQDFLAPIVARGFFADFMQHFIPTRLPDFVSGWLPEKWAGGSPALQRVSGQLSRGRAFEEAVERAWATANAAQPVGGAQASARNPFAQAFLEHWTPAEAAPALMLNATSVGDGRQIVIAPFRGFGGLYDIGYLYDQPELPIEKDLTLGTAVGLSGRFPWVLPPALVGDAGLALVDGAYFESSGIEALRTVRAALRPYEVKPTGSALFPYVKVHVIVIGGLRSVQGQGQAAADNQVPSMDEVTPPLRTLLNARDRRGYMADNTLRDWDGDIECPPQRPEALLGEGDKPSCLPTVRPLFRLDYTYFSLPLGWQLSKGMSEIVAQHARGVCQQGEGAATGKEFSEPQKILGDNGLSAALVPYYLSPPSERSKLVQERC
jgi:hypothetical protein